MKSGLLLDVVIGEGTAVLELLSSEDKTLLVRGNSFLVLDLLLHSLDSIGGLDLEGDGLPSEGLHEDLHTTTETKDQVKSGLLLDVVIGEGATVLQLLSSEDKTLLVRGNSFLVLDLLLHGLDSIGGLDLEGDGLSGKGLHEDLHTATETEDQMKGGFLLDVVIGEGTTILQLLPSENKTLLVRGNSFLVLDLLLHSLDSIGGLDLEGDGLPGEGLDENLHVRLFLRLEKSSSAGTKKMFFTPKRKGKRCFGEVISPTIKNTLTTLKWMTSINKMDQLAEATSSRFFGEEKETMTLGFRGRCAFC